MNELQIEISRFLAQKAARHQRTTYQEVGEAVGWKHPTGRGLGSNLEVILRDLHDQGLPPLTTILVKRGERHPAEDAMAYIRRVLGNVDIEATQAAVFSYDWDSFLASLPQPTVVPSGRDASQASFGALTAEASDHHRNVFLLKFNGVVHGPGGISRPKELEDWSDKVLKMPWSSPRASSHSDKSPGPKVSVGDFLYLWAHEDEAFGSGLGLTGTAIAKDVTEEREFLNIRLGSLVLLPHPFGFRSLGHDGWSSLILDRIDEDRSPRAWIMTPTEQLEVERLIEAFGSAKAAAKVSAELEHLSPLDRALVEDKELVAAAEEERKLAITKARPGQQKFRDEAMRRHDGRCVVTGLRVETVLEAAHVIPHTGNPAFEVPENSLILRRDIHALFDAGLIGIHPASGRLKVSPALNDTAYRKLEGKEIDHKLAQSSLRYQDLRFKKVSACAAAD